MAASLITSGAGAMGLMQVMPATYDDLRARYSELGDDPYDPHNNILAGTAYIREMYDIYGAPGFLAAYNAGPGRLDDYLTRSRSLPEETRRYVANIGPRIAGYSPSTPSPGEQYAMNSTPFNFAAGPRYAPSAIESAPIQVAEATRPFIKLNPVQPMAESVQVADAAPSRPFIKLNPPQPLPEPVQVAEAAPSRSYIQLSPPAPDYAAAAALPEPIAEPRRAPMQVARAEPPRYRAETRSMLASARSGSRETEFARLPEPPMPEPTRYAAGPRSQYAQRPYFSPPGPRAPVEVAEFAEPPRGGRLTQQQLAAAELAPPHGRFFGLIGAANAAPVRRPAAAGFTSGAWGVQVGAFANQGVASAATAAARENAREVLGGAHTVVAGVRQPGGTLYRARLTGLSREAAAQACERLSHARTNCMVVSPDAQY